MKNLLTETEVTKVGMNHERDHLRVYLSSTRLIHKKDIRQLESAIAQQIFKGRMMQVKVIEKYHLSEQYTPEKLLDLYRDSILEELKDYSLMEYNLLRTAKMEFIRAKATCCSRWRTRLSHRHVPMRSWSF